jgi:hypothetical protein
MAVIRRDELIEQVATAISRSAANRPRKEGTSMRFRRYAEAAVAAVEQHDAGAVDLVEQARGCVTAALNCTAHPWHGDDRARKWLMDADRLGGQ